MRSLKLLLSALGTSLLVSMTTRASPLSGTYEEAIVRPQPADVARDIAHDLQQLRSQQVAHMTASHQSNVRGRAGRKHRRSNSKKRCASKSKGNALTSTADLKTSFLSSSSSSSSVDSTTSISLEVPPLPDLPPICVGDCKPKRSCFPALDFEMPDKVPGSLDDWWCNPKDEYAFMGFSYSIASCPSYDQLVKDFKRQRKTYQARYVRLYSNCDKQGYNDDLINAAWEAGVGLLPLIWFGFDGDQSFRPRKKALLQTIKSNPKAAFVVRTIQFGSEPLFDWAISADGLAEQINDVKGKLSQYITGEPTAMQVSTSEMPYGYSIHGNAPKVFSSVSTLLANSLPFFAQDASTARKAFSHIQSDLDFLKKHGADKKILITQTGWPSNADVWKANSKAAQANVAQSKAYFDLLDQKCEEFKQGPKGGVGWFAHIWSDDGLPGWGVVGYDGKAKFDFKARVEC